MKSIFLFSFCLLLLHFSGNAQGNPWYPEEDTIPKKEGSFWHSADKYAKSVTLTGGYEMGGFKLGMLKLAYEYNHWSGGMDIFRQEFQMKWDSADISGVSTGLYRLNGFGVFGRFYMSKIARNAYAEIGAGVGQPKLTVTYPTGNKISDQWKLQYFQFGAGWRLGFRPRGLFGEIGYRGYLALSRVPILRTDAIGTLVYGREGRPIQYHIWYLRKYRLMNQFTVGLGYSF